MRHRSSHGALCGQDLLSLWSRSETTRSPRAPWPWKLLHASLIGARLHRGARGVSSELTRQQQSSHMAAKATDTDRESAKKQCILCLHGYLQNSEVFRTKAGSLRKGLKTRAEFHFVDAPHLVVTSGAEAQQSGGTTEQPRGWWTWQDTEPGMRPSLAARYSGWEASLDALVAAVDKLRPDGIFGFSQGATAAALLLAHLSQDEGRRALLPKFAILVAGFLPRDESFALQLRRARHEVPTLIVHGQADRLVPIERSRQLQDAMEEGRSGLERFEHPGAHMVPSCSGDFKQLLQCFIDSHSRDA